MNEDLAAAVRSIANAITPMGAPPAQVQSGGVVASLTEAQMHVGDALYVIAAAISELAATQRT